MIQEMPEVFRVVKRKPLFKKTNQNSTRSGCRETLVLHMPFGKLIYCKLQRLKCVFTLKHKSCYFSFCFSDSVTHFVKVTTKIIKHLSSVKKTLTEQGRSKSTWPQTHGQQAVCQPRWTSWKDTSRQNAKVDLGVCAWVCVHKVVNTTVSVQYL